MGYSALFVIAVIGHSASARSWRGHDDYYHHKHPMENQHYHNHPTGNQHNFNYNEWCHRPGGWNSNWGSWEDSSSGESQEWNDSKDKDRLTRAGDFDISISWEESSSGESEEWNDSKIILIIRSSTTTTIKSVVIDKTQSETTSSISVRLSSTGNTPSALDIMICLRSCPITSEYNPVCGTDNITYINPGRLHCAKSCGIDVALKRPSSCPTVNQNPATGTTTSPATTTISPQILATCMRSCQVTSEYNPICGTDYITYNNPSRLECAQGCGKPVTMLLPSRCPPPDQMTTTTPATPATSSSTATTPMAPTSSLRPSGPNPGPNVTPTDGSTTRFTIAQHILDGIFNGGSTTEYVPDFSLDERYE